ncbi:MAG: hypothetical protein RL653_2547, partial [Pseudomonadota bacterium]
MSTPIEFPTRNEHLRKWVTEM